MTQIDFPQKDKFITTNSLIKMLSQYFPNILNNIKQNLKYKNTQIFENLNKENIINKIN